MRLSCAHAPPHSLLDHGAFAAEGRGGGLAGITAGGRGTGMELQGAHAETALRAAMNASRTPRLLSDVNPADIVTEPYAHYARDSAIAASLYEELAADFPSLDVIVNHRSDVGSNEAVRM